MAALDNAFEMVLAVSWIGVTAVIAFAVLSWAYAALFVGGSAVALLVALVFIGFGAVIVFGSVQLYAPTMNPIEAFGRLLTFHWEAETQYYCEYCNRSFTQPSSLSGLDCPYCGTPDPEPIAG